MTPTYGATHEVRTRHHDTGLWCDWIPIPPSEYGFIHAVSKAQPDDIQMRPIAALTLAGFFAAAIAAGVVTCVEGGKFYHIRDSVELNLTDELTAMAAELGVTE